MQFGNGTPTHVIYSNFFGEGIGKSVYIHKGIRRYTASPPDKRDLGVSSMRNPYSTIRSNYL